MRRTFHVLFALALGACSPSRPPPSRVATQTLTPPRAPPTNDVVTERMTYAFRASPLVNLVYQLDCMSGMVRCSREAFEDTWKKTLGQGDGDRAALDSWRALHRRYSGTIHREGDVDDAPLPLWGVRLGMERNLRLAAYSARDADDALDRLSLFARASDVEEARTVMRRFEPRFMRYWATRKDDLDEMVAGFVRVMARPDLRALVDGIESFYEPELGSNARLVVQLVARPEHDSPDHGEQLANVSLVEVLPGHTAESRLDVILHEAFHFWFGASSQAKQRALVQRFVDSKQPLAIPACGLLDEVLAAALGNGLVGRMVDRAGFEKRFARAQGLYNDAYIDPVAKAMMPVLLARIAKHSSVFAPDFVAEYEDVAARALTNAGPAVFLRPLVSLYDHALEHAEFRLYDVVRSGHTESEDDFGEAGQKLLRSHPMWGTVIAVTPASLELLARVPDYVDKGALARIRAEAAKATPFVFTIPRERGAPVFVLVSKDDSEMMTLDDAFASLGAVHAGVWRP